jgi:LPXTG-motif cell wall-anchored protein
VRTPQSPPSTPETVATLPLTGAARVPVLLAVSVLAMSIGWLLVATNRRRPSITT